MKNSILKSSDDAPKWFSLELYNNKHKLMNLPLIYDNLCIRLCLFKPIDSHRPFTETLENRKLRTEAPDPPENFETLINEGLILVENKYEHFVGDDINMTNKKTKKQKKHLAGISMMSLHDITEFKKYIQNKFSLHDNSNHFSNENGIERLTRDEIELYNLSTKLEELLKDDDADENEISKTTDRINKLIKPGVRDILHDNINSILPNLVQIPILVDTSLPRIMLNDSFEKFLDKFHDNDLSNEKIGKSIVHKDGEIVVSTKLLNKFLNYRVFEFFDLSYWASCSNKKFTRAAIADIIFSDEYEKNRITMVNRTVALVNQYFDFEFIHKNLTPIISNTFKYQRFNQ